MDGWIMDNTAAFHLNDKEARCELKNAIENRILPFSLDPTYLGVKLDRLRTYCQHLESLRHKLTTRIGVFETISGIKLRCWCNNIGHSYLISDPFSC